MEITDSTRPEAAARPGYHIMTWGCQMNEEDSEQLGLFLQSMGYAEVQDPAEADVVLLNTCSVRAKPEEKVWSELGRLREIKSAHPDLIVGVCGCMAQIESARIRQRAPFVDMIVGTGNIASVPDLIRETLRRRQVSLDDRDPSYRAPADRNGAVTALGLPERKGAVVTDVPRRSAARAPKLKAHVPIMYGCDKFCTFCVVPFTRGRERSRPTEDILEEIGALARQGTQEVTLLGQTVNSYGKNLLEGRVPFAVLLEKIDAIPGIRRVRFTSPYPRDFTNDLIEAIAGLQSVCEHVHLPLQAADDDLLSEMRRGYTVARYGEIVERLRERVPGIAITTDIMLGFPGETDAQYRNTMRFVEETRFDSAFMFAYSARPGTKAAAREDQVPREVKIERLNALIALQNRITVEINSTQVGRDLEVLVEGRSPRDASRLTGYTRTLKTVNFTAPAGVAMDSLAGRLIPVRAVQAHLTGFTGEYAGR
jgi:tRNA-2-methylthio-N6-dimethylallyladenosine synthase